MLVGCGGVWWVCWLCGVVGVVCFGVFGCGRGGVSGLCLQFFSGAGTAERGSGRCVGVGLGRCGGWFGRSGEVRWLVWGGAVVGLGGLERCGGWLGQVRWLVS
mgnify:CR=1 FL=1